MLYLGWLVIFLLVTALQHLFRLSNQTCIVTFLVLCVFWTVVCLWWLLQPVQLFAAKDARVEKPRPQKGARDRSGSSPSKATLH